MSGELRENRIGSLEIPADRSSALTLAVRLVSVFKSLPSSDDPNADEADIRAIITPLSRRYPDIGAYVLREFRTRAIIDAETYESAYLRIAGLRAERRKGDRREAGRATDGGRRSTDPKVNGDD